MESARPIGDPLGNVIESLAIYRARDSGYLENLFIEGGHFRSFIVPPNPDGTFPEDWYEIIGHDMGISLTEPSNLETLNPLFAFNDINRFIELNTIDDDEVDWGIHIEYAEGFGPEDFYYSDDAYEKRMPVPVILPQSILDMRGLGIGDTAYIGYTRLSWIFLEYIPTIIIGSHNGEMFRENASEAAFIPISFYESVMGGMAYFSSFSFTVKPEYNRYLDQVREELSDITLGHDFALTDYDFHTMIGLANQTLLLLRLVYPLAVATSIIIAFGLGLLLMLQTSKNASILRVLGARKAKAMLMLLSEQIIVSLTGVAFGMAALAALASTFDRQFAFVLGMYLAAVLAGAIIGSVTVCNRTPIRMLQVKE
jgi:hypothetical protein